jgi:hypothetical protein
MRVTRFVTPLPETPLFFHRLGLSVNPIHRFQDRSLAQVFLGFPAFLPRGQSYLRL